MKAIETYRQEKSIFIAFLSLYVMISFLAVCILFGLYIYKSFDSGNIIATQTQDGFNNKQGVAGESVTIN